MGLGTTAVSRLLLRQSLPKLHLLPCGQGCHKLLLILCGHQGSTCCYFFQAVPIQQWVVSPHMTLLIDWTLKGNSRPSPWPHWLPGHPALLQLGVRPCLSLPILNCWELLVALFCQAFSHDTANPVLLLCQAKRAVGMAHSKAQDLVDFQTDRQTDTHTMGKETILGIVATVRKMGKVVNFSLLRRRGNKGRKWNAEISSVSTGPPATVDFLQEEKHVHTDWPEPTDSHKKIPYHCIWNVPQGPHMTAWVEAQSHWK